MPTSTTLKPIAKAKTTEKELSNPTPHQQAIYDFHDRTLSSSANDIFSTEWYQRSKQWSTQFSTPDVPVFSWDPQDFPFGAFFLAHPVAAYSLWNVGEATYRLDQIICGEREIVAAWREMSLFEYLHSDEVRERWRRSLKMLRCAVQTGRLQGLGLGRWLDELLGAIEGVDDELGKMRESFEVSLGGAGFARGMVRCVEEGVEERRVMIAEGLRLEEGVEGGGNECEEERRWGC